VTEEERESKYVRMLTSSLLGVKRLLSLLLQSDRAALEERLAHLLNSGKFWKYSKHKTPQVLTSNVTHRRVHSVLCGRFHSTEIRSLPLEWVFFILIDGCILQILEWIISDIVKTPMEITQPTI